MADEPEDIAKAEILGFAHAVFKDKPDEGFGLEEAYDLLKDELAKYGFMTVNEVKGLVKLMVETGHLHELGMDRYVISAKGHDKLNTTYNDEWVSRKMDATIRQRKEKEEKERKQYELEERRHQEVVKAAREGNKIQRYMVWIALFLGAIGLIVAIFKP